LETNSDSIFPDETPVGLKILEEPMSHHHHDKESDMSFREKLEKLLQHWVKHNTDHAETYREWMKKAEMEDMKEVANRLQEAAAMTIQINEKFKEAIRSVVKT